MTQHLIDHLTELQSRRAEAINRIGVLHRAAAQGDDRAAAQLVQADQSIADLDRERASVQQQLEAARQERVARAITLAQQAQQAQDTFEHAASDAYPAIREAIERMLAAHADLVAQRLAFLRLLQESPDGPGALIGDLQRAEVDMHAVQVRWTGTLHSAWCAGIYTPPPLGPYGDVLYREVFRIVMAEADAAAHRPVSFAKGW